MIAQSLLGRTIVSKRAREVGLRIFAILFISTLFLGGVQLRRWTGQNTRHVRYQHDIVNGFYWGQEALKEARRLSPGDSSANSWTGLFRGYLALYDRVKEDAYEDDYGLDYPPLRLLTMSSLTAHRAVAASLLAIAAVCLTNCASVSHHKFSEPAAGWQTKTGQLMYRTPKATLIGEAIVRFSKAGDFELTVSKGPGITLLSLRQDAAFAEINASFTGQHWSGPTASAPSQLRGWLGLRDEFLRAPNQKTLRYATGSETFLFRF